MHGGTPRGVLHALTTALARSRHRPTVAELEHIYTDLSKAAVAIKGNLRADSLYSARPFTYLVRSHRACSVAPTRKATSSTRSMTCRTGASREPTRGAPGGRRVDDSATAGIM